MKYLIGLVVTILVILFIIVRLLGGGGGDEQPTIPRQLADYGATSTTMRYVIDTAITAPENHRRVEIIVGRDDAVINVQKGYDGEIIRSRSYDMSASAYTNFLFALDRTAGYTEGNDDSNVRDERGYCATGNRYSYDIIDGSGTVLQHYWSTSCKQRTFRGDSRAVMRLFEDQIPDFDELTQDVDF